MLISDPFLSDLSMQQVIDRLQLSLSSSEMKAILDVPLVYLKEMYGPQIIFGPEGDAVAEVKARLYKAVTEKTVELDFLTQAFETLRPKEKSQFISSEKKMKFLFQEGDLRQDMLEYIKHDEITDLMLTLVATSSLKSIPLRMATVTLMAVSVRDQIRTKNAHGGIFSEEDYKRLTQPYGVAFKTPAHPSDEFFWRKNHAKHRSMGRISLFAPNRYF